MIPAALRPRRSLFVPTLSLLAPALWFTYRGANAPPQVTGAFEATPGTLAVLVVGSTAASYTVAATVVSALGLDAVETTGRPLLAAVVDPADEALAVLGVVAAGVAGYLVVAQSVDLPGWVDAAAGILGVAVALPLGLAYAGALAVENALAVESFAFEAAAVAVGVSLSVVWVALLASGAAAVLGPTDRTVDR